jgi:hypothetical protein
VGKAEIGARAFSGLWGDLHRPSSTTVRLNSSAAPRTIGSRDCIFDETFKCNSSDSKVSSLRIRGKISEQFDLDNARVISLLG